jgi:hypothetical protein
MGYWREYREKGRRPALTGDFVKDGGAAEEFVEASAFFWRRAKEVFPMSFAKKGYQALISGQGDKWLAGELEWMMGLWATCSVNIGTGDDPGGKERHRDLQNCLHALSCLCPLGYFHGGDLDLWDIGVVVQLKAGDLFYFPDHLIDHSNRPVVSGMQHSVVGFIEHKTWDWKMEKLEKEDRLTKGFREAATDYRKRKAEVEDSLKIKKRKTRQQYNSLIS